MKFLFFIFILMCILIAAPLSYAATLSGSPSSLEYNVHVGEQKCLIFAVSSSDYSENLYSVMKWADKDAQVSSPNDLVLDSSDINLGITYSPESITNFDGQQDIKVCITGNEIGTWKGSLEYRTETQGNIGVGVGTWLRVNITEKPKEEEPVKETPQAPPGSPNNENSGGSSGGSRGSSSAAVGNSTTNEYANSSVNNSENTETTQGDVPLGNLEDSEKTNPGITGAVIGFAKSNGKPIAGIALVIALVIIGIFAGKKFRKNKEE